MCDIRCLPALILLPALLLVLAVPGQLLAFEHKVPVFVQAMVGAAQFNEDDLTFTETASDGTEASGNDLSNMPYLGMSFQFPFRGKETQIGLDSSLLFGWRTRKRSSVISDGDMIVRLDSSFWIGDLSLGLFVKRTYADRWSLYAAAGPVMAFGEHSYDVDEEELDTGSRTQVTRSESEFGVGGYARVGFDYRFGTNSYIGVCLRGLATNMKFDGAPRSSSSLGGVQGFVTFSRYFSY